jgi:chromosome segregation ATPase
VWQAVASVAALITAVAGGGVGIAGFVRSSRAADAKSRSDAAGVGLQYLEKALAAQQVEITRQEGEIGELRGHLESCREERQALAVEIAELRDRMP